MVIMEPVQNAGGSFTPPEGYWAGVREICDRYGILLCADEVITGFGRLGAWFGSERYDIRPDLVTCAKGLSSAHAWIGAVIARDAVMEPFLEGKAMYTHGMTFGGHPVQAAIALKNIEIMKRERIVEHVAEEQDAFRETLAQLLDLPIVGDLRGTGFFYALELVKDKETRETFSEEECETLLRGFLSPRLFEADSSAAPTTAATPSSRSRRRSSPNSRSSTRSSASSARCSPRPRSRSRARAVPGARAQFAEIPGKLTDEGHGARLPGDAPPGGRAPRARAGRRPGARGRRRLRRLPHRPPRRRRRAARPEAAARPGPPDRRPGRRGPVERFAAGDGSACPGSAGRAASAATA